MTRLARLQRPGQHPRIGVVDGEQVRLTPHATALEWLENPDQGADTEAVSWPQLVAGEHERFRLLSPIDPPEVWACGFTYRRGPQFGASPAIPSGPAYEAAVDSGRPEVFFKTTGWRVVGPNDGIGIRGDATYTAVEAELCAIVGADGAQALHTAGNDVSAWDIEAKNPLWLAQGKTYEACCGLGPVAVTPDEVPADASIRCRVLRNGAIRFEGEVSISEMHWSVAEIVAFASIYNPLPPGAVVMTGTAIIRPDSESLAEGDVAEIEIDGIGVLRNRGRRLVSPVPAVPYR